MDREAKTAATARIVRTVVSPMSVRVTSFVHFFIKVWLVLLILRLRCCRRRRRRRRRGRDVMIRREDAQFEFGADGGVGRVGGRKFQVGGVLNGQDVFVGVTAVAFLAALWPDCRVVVPTGNVPRTVVKVAVSASVQLLRFITAKFAARR